MPRHRAKKRSVTTEEPSKFRNVIFCEDVREEVGNKKSLMGVVGGDLLVGAFPATIQMAVFFEYLADDRDGDSLSVKFRLLQDDKEFANGVMEANLSATKRANFILPKSFIGFESPATFRLLASVNGRPETELLAKKIMLRAIANAPEQPSSQSQPASSDS